MVEDLAVAQDDEPPAGDAAKELEQPPVARSVNTRGPHDVSSIPVSLAAACARRSPSSFVTDRCPLGEAARPRSPADARCRRGPPRCCSGRRDGRRQPPRHVRSTRPLGVDPAIGGLGQSSLTIEGGDVIDDFDSADSLVENPRVARDRPSRARRPRRQDRARRRDHAPARAPGRRRQGDGARDGRR